MAAAQSICTRDDIAHSLEAQSEPSSTAVGQSEYFQPHKKELKLVEEADSLMKLSEFLQPKHMDLKLGIWMEALLLWC